MGFFTERERELLGWCLMDAEDDGNDGEPILERFLDRTHGEQHPRADYREWQDVTSKVNRMEDNPLHILIASLRRDRVVRA